MRILANENIPGETVNLLRQKGHDISWIRTEKPGSKDREIIQQAHIENRLLVTFDKDFGELAFRYKLPAASGIVLFRISKPSPAEVANTIVTVLESRSDWSGHFSVVEDDRIRMTPLP
ncbi:MAG: DUF5615 family PIN-like protein [Chloroflexi bacterium]|nr:DUF5615 family PIN-like protein [Chloroflexota bacterium]